MYVTSSISSHFEKFPSNLLTLNKVTNKACSQLHILTRYSVSSASHPDCLELDLPLSVELDQILLRTDAG
jgi:hypothetical protein